MKLGPVSCIGRCPRAVRREKGQCEDKAPQEIGAGQASSKILYLCA